MSKKKAQPVISKIDMDEKTKEPIIVEITEEELSREVKEKSGIPSLDFVEVTTDKSLGKQLVMKKVLGSTSKDLTIKKETTAIGKRQKIFKLLISIVFIVFVVCVLAYTFYKDFFIAPSNQGGGRQPFPDLERLNEIFITSKNWRFFIYAIFALFCVYFFKALKLSIMCKALTKRWHFKTCFETAVIGNYYNAVTPLAVGGQPFEIYHLSKHGVHGGTASSIPVATFFLNQIAFVGMGIAALVIVSHNSIDFHPYLLGVYSDILKSLSIIGMICCFAVPALVVIVCLSPRFGAILVKFVVKIGGKLRLVKDPEKTTIRIVKGLIHNANSLKKIGRKPFALIPSLLLSILEQLSTMSIVYFVMEAFGFNLKTTTTIELTGINLWFQVVCIAVLLYLAISFIPTPGNAGAADISFYNLFSVGIFNAGLTFPLTAVWRLFSFYSFIIIGFIFATIKKRSDTKKRKLGLIDEHGDTIKTTPVETNSNSTI